MKAIQIHYNGRGPSGNIYWIFGAFTTLCTDSGLLTPAECRYVIERATRSGSYTAALAVLGEYVDLIDDDATMIGGGEG